MNPQTRQQGQIEILVVIVVVAAAAAYALFSQKLIPQLQQPTVNPSPEATPMPTPTPTTLISGKETYKISQGPAFVGPKVSQAVIDPLDPGKGNKQIVTVSTNYTSPIDFVTIKLITDTTSQTYPLQLVSGTNTNGDWQGSWTINDSYLYTYIMEITAKSGGVGTPIPLGIRQPAPPSK